MQIINADMHDSTSLYRAGKELDSGVLASGVSTSTALASRELSLTSRQVDGTFCNVLVERVNGSVSLGLRSGS